MVSQNTEETKSTMQHHSIIGQPDINDSKKKFIRISQVHPSSQFNNTYI